MMFPACSPDQNKAFSDAADHCKRAIYDAWDAGTIFALEQEAEFSVEYRLEQIQPVIPDFLVLRTAVKSVKRAMQQIPHSRRSAYYLDAEARYRKLIEIVDRLELLGRN